MLKKALQGHPFNNGSQNKTLSQQYKTDHKALKPTQSSLLNSRAPWPSTSNPLKRTSSQISGSENPGSNQDETNIELESAKVMKSSQNKSRLAGLHANVQFEEDDFDDDDVINLDEDVLPSVEKGLSSSATLTDSIPKDSISDAKQIPSSSAQALSWSSSPLSHLEMPLPRQPLPAAQEGSGPQISKRRKLPWQAEEQAANAKAAAVGSKPSRGAKQRQPPDFVQEMLANSGKRSSLEEGDASTPFQSESTSPYPWDKTASAIKKEQKKLRNAYQNKMGKEDKGKPTNMVPKETMARVFLSDEQKHVLELVAEKGKSVFFTGSAGTGKSVLLREIIKVLRDKHKREPDRVAVSASTGLAACNVGGVTLHSFAGIGLGKEDVPELVKKIKRNQKAKQRWLRTKVLIVDEISMVDGDLFDKLEAIARAIRNNGRPFGGIQLVITGDFFQLPPVPDYQKAAKFSFDAGTWNTSIEHTIGLTQVFRQKDPTFANMLNEMRLGRLTPKSIDSFRKLCRPLSFADDFEATELFPTRNEVDAANSARMRNLSTKAFDFDALDGGSIQDVGQRDKLLSNCMAPKSLSLKKGAQVMLIKNIDEQLVNGSVGRVMAFMDERTFDMYEENEDAFQYSHMLGSDDESIALSKQKLKQLINKDGTASTSRLWPVVRFDIQGGQTRDLLCQSESWKIELPSGEVQASRQQIPLILAWALSIHKAQGQTLNRVKVDLGKIFEKGQAYVALSRATCQEGLQIIRFDPKKVMAHDRVRTFYDGLYSVNHSTPVPDTKPLAGGKRLMGLEGDEDSDSLAAMYG